MVSLENQVALITGTGSSSGIGFACARMLGEAGATIFLVSTTARIHERVKELEALEITARGVVSDLTKPEQVTGLIKRIISEFGRLDICVNNAGMTVVGEVQFESPVDDIPLVEWNRSLERNLTTCFLVTKTVLPIMRRQKYGRIVNIPQPVDQYRLSWVTRHITLPRQGCGDTPVLVPWKPLRMR